MIRSCSVLDTFPDVGELDVGVSGDIEESEETADAATLPPQGVPLASAAAEPSKPVRRKRRTAALKAIEISARGPTTGPSDIPVVSVSDKRREAIKARWSKRRELDTAQGEVACESKAAEDFLWETMPLQGSSTSLVNMGLETAVTDPLCRRAVNFNPTETAEQYKRELDVFNSMVHMVSTKAVAEHLKLDEKTVKRTSRLLSAMCVLSKRGRNLWTAQRVHEHLKSISGGGDKFRALQYLIKDSFDEVSLPVNTLSDVRGVDEKNDKTIGTRESAITKLVQQTSSTHCLWRVHGQYIRLRLRQPTTLTPIDRTTAECMLGAALRQFPDEEVKWAEQTFWQGGRISVADEHPSNSKMDWALFALYDFLKLSQYVCKFHKFSKSGHVALKAFPLDKTGFTHSTLTFKFTGSWIIFKEALKKEIRDTLKFYEHGEHGAGAAAADYREKIHTMFSRYDDGQLSGPGVAAARALALAKEELINGNIRNEKVVEHYCRCQPPCRDRSHTIERIDREVVDRLECPKIWNWDKWMGPEHSFSFHGQWMATHKLLPRAFIRAFGARTETAASAPGGGEEHDDHDELTMEHVFAADVSADGPLYALPIADGDPGHAASVDPYEQFPSEQPSPMIEPDKEMNSFERQTTYRKNATTWYQSDPLPRFMALRNIEAVKQHAMAKLAQQIGTGWEDRELHRRNEGQEPRYRGLMIHKGEFTNTARREYASLIRDPHHWENAICQEDKSHSLSNACFRSCTGADAAIVQLQQAREKTYPYVPYGLITADELRRYTLACRIVRDLHECPGKMGPYWESLFQKFKTPLDIAKGIDLSVSEVSILFGVWSTGF